MASVEEWEFKVIAGNQRRREPEGANADESEHVIKVRNKNGVAWGIAIILLSVVLTWAGFFIAALNVSVFGVFMAFVVNVVGLIWGVRNFFVGWAYVGLWWRITAVLMVPVGLLSVGAIGLIWLFLVNYPLGGPY